MSHALTKLGLHASVELAAFVAGRWRSARLWRSDIRHVTDFCASVGWHSCESRTAGGYPGVPRRDDHPHVPVTNRPEPANSLQAPTLSPEDTAAGVSTDPIGAFAGRPHGKPRFSSVGKVLYLVTTTPDGNSALHQRTNIRSGIRGRDRPVSAGRSATLPTRQPVPAYTSPPIRRQHHRQRGRPQAEQTGHHRRNCLGRNTTGPCWKDRAGRLSVSERRNR